MRTSDATNSPAPALPLSGHVAVLLPLPLTNAYTYAVPEGMSVRAGDFVEVPLGNRRAIGVVWGEADRGESGMLDPARIKPLLRRLEAQPLPDMARQLIDWVASYTFNPPGAVLKMSMSVPEALEPERDRLGFVATGAHPEKLSPQRRRVLELAGEGPARSAADLAEAAACSVAVVHGLQRAGALREVPLPVQASFAEPDAEHTGIRLSEDQSTAAMQLRANVAADQFNAVLLEGVTGAGKTEVYFEAIAEALRRGQQALVMLPEIALTQQWLERFERRFGCAPAAWHSELGPRVRRLTWRAVADGSARVVVGARSALFLPFRNLGLIIVDEEHDASYKQEEGVIYNARDMAVVRAKIGAIPVILASATPSLETVSNARRGRYQHLRLTRRHGVATMPEISAIDLRRAPPSRGRFLSPVLTTALTENLAAGEQSMLFLNRRGYAPLTLCGACGHRMQCPNCTTWLVEHRQFARLQCHHCGHAEPIPSACPACGAEGSLKPCGPGVERLAEEVGALLPEARIVVLASDMIAGPAQVGEVLRQIEAREVDVIVGTQIVAKGHHFPYLTLVGVVDADLGLEGGDLRAAERTLQLLTQVAGRAGRAEHSGRVFLQTFDPDHPVIAALARGDTAAFVEAEMSGRERAQMPPFGRLAALIVSSEKPQAARQFAERLGRSAPQLSGIDIFGPVAAPLAQLRGRHRYRLLVKAPANVAVQDVLHKWLSANEVPSNVRLTVDIDPYSFL